MTDHDHPEAPRWPTTPEEEQVRAQIAPPALEYLRELTSKVEAMRADVSWAERVLESAVRVSLQSAGVPADDLPNWRLDLRRGFHVRALRG